MYRINIIIKNSRGLFLYVKTIEHRDKNEFCNLIGRFFLESKEFRNHLALSTIFNCFGYKLFHPANIYLSDMFLNEQRFCTYSDLTCSEINTMYSASIDINRKKIASHLVLSSPTVNSHYNSVNVNLGGLSDEQTIIVVQNS